jgi:hypothetical protein
VRIGFANTVEDVLRTGEGDVGKVFDGKGRLGAMILSRLLSGLIVLGACLPYAVVVLAAALVTSGFEREEGLGIAILIAGTVLYAPVLAYVWLGIVLSDQAVALEGLQPVDSIRRSWSLARGHRWMLFLVLARHGDLRGARHLRLLRRHLPHRDDGGGRQERELPVADARGGARRLGGCTRPRAGRRGAGMGLARRAQPTARLGGAAAPPPPT